MSDSSKSMSLTGLGTKRKDPPSAAKVPVKPKVIRNPALAFPRGASIMAESPPLTTYLDRFKAVPSEDEPEIVEPPLKRAKAVPAKSLSQAIEEAEAEFEAPPTTPTRGAGAGAGSGAGSAATWAPKKQTAVKSKTAPKSAKPKAAAAEKKKEPWKMDTAEDEEVWLQMAQALASWEATVGPMKGARGDLAKLRASGALDSAKAEVERVMGPAP